MAPEIKFCGLTREDDAAAAARLGAAYAGVIFAKSPRQLDAARAAHVLDAAASWTKRVGVFDARPAIDIAAIARDARLQIIQLHGDPTASMIDELRRRFDGEIWAVVRVRDSELSAATASLFSAADGVVLDSHSPERLGGNGIALDWSTLQPQVDRARARSTASFVLAGGLRAENVARAIAILSPDIVDVSSGVETSPGVKDHARMRAFADSVVGAAAA